MMADKQKLMLGACAVAVLAVGYVFGATSGYKKGYNAAEQDVKKIEEEAGKKAAEEAAKAANPFQAVNPLEGVEANPFEKAKKILNPFE